MKYFSPAQIEEIRKQLATLGVRDTDLPYAHEMTGDELIAIVQDNVNRLTSIKDFFREFLPEDFVERLVEGESAYEIARRHGFEGSEQEWLDSLHGADGRDGVDGHDGQDGADGKNGVNGTNGAPGAAAGFGTPTASIVSDTSGEPGVNVYASGPDTAKVFDFVFKNIGSGGGSHDGGDSDYELPVASRDELGGIKIGHQASGQDDYPVVLDGNNRAYVVVPGGGSGSGGVTKYWDQAFKCVTDGTKPTKPSNDNPINGTVDGWNKYIVEPLSGSYDVWMTVRWVEGNTASDWRDPWCISGEDGVGYDGAHLEFIYARTISEDSTSLADPNSGSPSSESSAAGHLTPASNDFVPDGWYDSANMDEIEIDPTNRVMWMCYRINESDAAHPDGEWSAFIGPFMWSVWGKQGIDGDGIEYIFYADLIHPAYEPDDWTDDPDFQSREYIRSGTGWVDNPVDLSGQNYGPGYKQWVSVRKKYADTTPHETYGTDPYWHEYSAPALWGYYPDTSGVYADFDNDMMAVATYDGGSNDGKNKAYGNVANVYMHSGAVVLDTLVTDFVVEDSSSTPVDYTSEDWVTYSAITEEVDGQNVIRGYTVTVDLPDAAINLQNTSLNVRITLSSTVDEITVSKTATLQIIGVNFGADGSSYDLVVGTASIRVNKNNQKAPDKIYPLITKFSGRTPAGNPFTPLTIQSDDPKFQVFYEIDDNGTEVEMTPHTGGSSLEYVSTSSVNNCIRFELDYNGMLVDQETIWITRDGSDGSSGPSGSDGEDAIYLDLTNENDTMLYSDESTLVSGNVTSQAVLRKGGDVVSSGVSYSINAVGCNASISTNTITVTGMTAVSGVVTVTATYNSKNYTAQLNLKKQVGGTKYDLIVSPDAFTYNTSTSTLAPQNTAHVHIMAGFQVGSRFDYKKLLALPAQTSTESWAIKIDGNVFTGSGSTPVVEGDFNVNTSLNGHTVQLVRTTIETVGGSTQTVATVIDEEFIPIGKFADGEDGQDGAGGASQLPVRFRKWSEVYEEYLTDDNKVFSGYEQNAKFRDVILVTEADYSGIALGYPFIEGSGANAKAVPVLLTINYDPDNHANGYYGNDLSFPRNADGVYPKNYTDDLPADADASEDAYDDGYMWTKFISLGAIYVQLLAAEQAYINNLTSNFISTNTGNGSYVQIQGGFINFYDSSDKLRIKIGQDTNDSSPVLKFYDSDGTTVLYDLGPQGIVNNGNQFVPHTWTMHQAYYSSSQFTVGDKLSLLGSKKTIYKYEDGYRFVYAQASGVYAIQYTNPFATGGYSGEHSALHEKYFKNVETPTSSNYYSNYADSYYYMLPPGATEEDEEIMDSTPGASGITAQILYITNASSGTPRLQTITRYVATLTEVQGGDYEIASITSA